MQHLLSLKDYSKQQIEQILKLAMDLKANPAKYADALKGKSVITLYEKPSLRTRVTFDIGINRLGGHAVYLDSQNGAMGSRETVQDFAANLSRWSDAIVARVFEHKTLVELTEHATVPVINSLCNLYHPCQALADYMTIAEQHDDLSKVHLAYVGDGNNVTNSLLLAGAILGATVTSVCPRGRNVDAQILKEAEALAAMSGGKVQVADSLDGLTDVDVLYTDTWVSMGDNTPMEQVTELFMPYQINQKMLDNTGAKQVLHCQPAHRELEITSEVMDGPSSFILDQAENRMHVQNAVLLTLINRDMH
ncbi:ornithine carbamoyltransferase [Oceanisphaera pacifica]|uniref:Ornithine carbamoyltransferase n=1 Tax=Oceanisphaera pacifica TaxID=2818389 RepID=A0ABS3NHS3_9GAMM|nr:ornithine carbamoyltransferase [Oceanisphaera pacifica]MBO1519857.1 ornithine carbamoyltransferase [Oceanisphaera pacifica]